MKTVISKSVISESVGGAMAVCKHLRRPLLIVILFVIAIVPARAATYYKYRLEITNLPVVSATLDAGGDTRRWTNNTPANAGKFLQATNTLQAATTNLYYHLIAYGFTNVNGIKAGTNDAWSPTNTIVLESAADHFITLTSLSNWCSITITTNSGAAGWLSVRIPHTNEQPTLQTQIVNGVVQILNDARTNNAVNTNAPAFRHYAVTYDVPKLGTSNTFLGNNYFSSLILTQGSALIIGATNFNPALANGLHIQNHGANAIASLNEYANESAIFEPQFWFVRYRGELGNRSNVLAGDSLGSHLWLAGHTDNSTLFGIAGAIKLVALKDFASATNDGLMRFQVGKGGGLNVATPLDVTANTITNNADTFLKSNITALAGADLAAATIRSGNTTNTTMVATTNIAANLEAATATIRAGNMTGTVVQATSLLGTNFIITTDAVIGNDLTVANESSFGSSATFASELAVPTANITTAANVKDLNTTGTNKFDLSISFTATNITSLANGANLIDPGLKTFIRVSGPTLAYSLDKIQRGYDGRFIRVHKNDSLTFTVVNKSGSGGGAEADKIETGTGGTITITNNPGVADFTYDATLGHWVLGYHSN